ncbi:uncharacterized protein FOMMEDRAFT_162197 [Fomitiporia mediterranea MF3/22]|uniref:uncharacterized protein n=1 Tax=Fomitiporia mediterranea (strain MF3/22) TaxID=694068 RepID=UPI000440920D|nr:uncharacterized protein FOMMEDRAFT_162197 [Fomitiporia mediterranea MF3/22]EJC97859.1 hypothetical protein FOMMEDRAFT_162197 [Fomitiporia mediterranea MF3/22]
MAQEELSLYPVIGSNDKRRLNLRNCGLIAHPSVQLAMMHWSAQSSVPPIWALGTRPVPVRLFSQLHTLLYQPYDTSVFSRLALTTLQLRHELSAECRPLHASLLQVPLASHEQYPGNSWLTDKNTSPSSTEVCIVYAVDDTLGGLMPRARNVASRAPIGSQLLDSPARSDLRKFLDMSSATHASSQAVHSQDHACRLLMTWIA